jgi:hypothetical protein
MENIYYVYALIDPRTNLPFYIGKGKNNRMLQHLKKGSTNGVKKNARIEEIRLAGFEPAAVKLIENMFEEDAYAFEENAITELGREDIDNHGILTNNRLHAWGPVMTEEVRSAISAWRIGITFTDEHRKNLSKAKSGKTYEEIYSKESAKKRREQLAKKRGPITEERKNNISKAKKGMNPPHDWSDDSRKKVSNKLTGVPKNLSDNERKRRQEINNILIQCPYCGVNGKGLSMKRWHFAKCKERIN